MSHENHHQPGVPYFARIDTPAIRPQAVETDDNAILALASQAVRTKAAVEWFEAHCPPGSRWVYINNIIEVTGYSRMDNGGNRKVIGICRTGPRAGKTSTGINLCSFRKYAIRDPQSLCPDRC